jgi:putative redox protein
MGKKIVNSTVKMVEGLQMVGYADSGHGIVIDTSPEGGGLGKGTSPMELVLIALASCSAMDVISILKKKREKLTGLEVRISGDRAETDPKVYTAVRIHYVFEGQGLSEIACRKAIDLSQEKYCSVLGMVSKTAQVASDWEIREWNAGENRPADT